MKNKVLFFACIIQACTVFSQTESAILDLESTTKGVLVPRMTTGQRTAISNAASGLLVFDASTESFWFKGAGGWEELVSGSVDDADADPMNEIQTLSTAPGSLSISEGNTVDLKPDLLTDADGDTKIQVEKTADDDVIRFDIGGSERMTLDEKTLHLNASGNSLFIGKNAGANDDGTSNQNTLIGYQAGSNNTSGSTNTMVGYLAGSGNSTGSSNTFMGWASGQNNSGSSNTFLGMWSGFINTSGSDNTFLGKEAGKANQIGNNNTLLGRSAGLLIKGSGNICLGYEAGKNFTGSNRLYIDNNDTSTPLIWGDLAANKLKVYGLLGIGDEYTFPAIDGQEGQVLTTDGFGQISWSSSPIIKKLSDMDFDTKIQVEESADEDVIRFDVKGVEVASFDGQRLSMPFVRIGEGAGGSNSFSSNIAIGDNAMNPVGGTEGNNVAIGTNTLSGSAQNSTAVGFEAIQGGGDFNTGVGSMALKFGGFESVAVGSGAMSNNYTFFGTAIGHNALFVNSGGNNTAIGHKALSNNTDGALNTAVGSNAMNDNLTGDENVAVGVNALDGASPFDNNFNTSLGTNTLMGLANGDYITAVGYASNVTSANLSNATVIGANATVGCSDCLVLDTDADVGIRNANPACDLHVKHQNGGVNGNGFRLENEGNGNYFRFYTASPGELWVYSDESPTSIIAEVDPMSGTWTAVSDARRKKNISPLKNILPQVLSLNPETYHFAQQNSGEEKHIGFLAQDVQPLFPSLVKYHQEEDSYTMDYSGFGVLAVAAIQEQQIIIENLKEKMQFLEERISQMENEE